MKFRESKYATAIAALACLGILGACGQSPANHVESSSDFTNAVNDAIADAQGGNASDRQLAILTGALNTHEVTTESMRDSARAVVDCLDDHGIEARTTESISSVGIPMPNFEANIADDDPALEAIVDNCGAQEMKWVSDIYAAQPSTVEATDKYVQQQLPTMRKCIVDNGGTIAETAATDEVLNEASRLLTESSGEIDCYHESDLDNF